MLARHSYDLDLFEYEFLLKDVLGLFDSATYAESREAIAATLAFCNDGFVESGRNADREGCALLPDGSVRTPADFPIFVEKFRSAFTDTLGAGEAKASLHPSVRYAILELLMGANASFMTYFGFNGASIDMLRRYGGFEQSATMIEKLADMAWASCLCITEDLAGSDLSQIETRGERLEDGTYSIVGRKRLISAGMHDLAENIVYFVLAQTNAAAGNAGLSCFAVPRFWIEADGRSSDNHVRCVDLPDKMGFRGCANPTLEYGIAGPTRGLLMGGREGVGLLQLLTLMIQARVSTGIYALGNAANAYRSAVLYARERKQGRSFRQTMNWRAPVVPIIEHPDVQRMLLSMKSQVEAGRALIALLGSYQAEHAAVCVQDPKSDNSARLSRLINLLTPIIKAYLSDQAWRVCETAIQVHGGNGYLRDYAVEQAARDVKVLSIWEGTNYIQSQYLIRDVFGLGVRSSARADFVAEVQATLDDPGLAPELSGLRDELSGHLADWGACLDRIAEWTKAGALEEVPKIASRFLVVTAQLTSAWLLLRCASAANVRLGDGGDGRERFLKGKVASAHFFYRNVMPDFAASVSAILDRERAVFEEDAEIFVF